MAVLINKLSALINIRMRTMFLFAHSLFTFLLISINGVFAQEKNISHVYQYAREVIDTMASLSMHGRGYVNDGDKIAANYISEEYKKIKEEGEIKICDFGVSRVISKHQRISE